jgi:hypothetical protein
MIVLLFVIVKKKDDQTKKLRFLSSANSKNDRTFFCDHQNKGRSNIKNVFLQALKMIVLFFVIVKKKYDHFWTIHTKNDDDF